jgi:hypothetical protein
MSATATDWRPRCAGAKAKTPSGLDLRVVGDTGRPREWVSSTQSHALQTLNIMVMGLGHRAVEAVR